MQKGKNTGSRKNQPGKNRKSKKNLPASGFAEDILDKKKSEKEYAEVSDRIYKFADKIKKDELKKEQSRREEDVYETWVIFGLAGEWFGLPVSCTREILRVESITRVPHAPFPVIGVTNLRGSVLAVVDLRLRLELQDAEITKDSCILVVESRDRLLGLLVDSVREITHLAVNRIKPVPDDVMTKQSFYISGVYQSDDLLVILLDIDKILLIFNKDEEST